MFDSGRQPWYCWLVAVPEKYRHQFEEMREQALADLQDARELAAEVQARISELTDHLTTLNGILGIEEGAKPKGARAVAVVARELLRVERALGNNDGIPISEIVDQLQRRGWAPKSSNPQSAVRTAIARLRAEDPAWRLEKARLYYDREPT